MASNAPDNKSRIESEMDRFEAELSSLTSSTGGGSMFLPSQLRKQPTATKISAAPAVISAPPVIKKPSQQVHISGAPQVYKSPTKTPTLNSGIKPKPPVVTSMVPASIVKPQPPFSGPIKDATATSSEIYSVPVNPTPTTNLQSSSSSGTSATSLSLAKDASISTPGTSKEITYTKKKSKSEKKPKKYVRSAGGAAWEDPTLLDWDPSDFRLFCGDLGNDVTDEVLTRVFGRYPSFQKAKVVRDKRSNKTKGFGFVSFKDPNDFVRAIRELDGRYVGSRPIKLRKSNWKNRNIDQVRKKEKERKQLLGLKKQLF